MIVKRLGHCPSCMRLSETEGRCSHCGGDLHRENAPFLLPVGTILPKPGVPDSYGYEIGAALGQGGFGVTYIGRDIAADRRVAIKEYFPIQCAQRSEGGTEVEPLPGMEDIYEGGRYSFVKEARVLAELEGMPSVVQALAYLETNNTAYLVMEYLDGTPLHRMVDPKTGKRIPPEKLLPPLKKLLCDISLLHDKCVIHRDIAPDNIMWMPDNTLKLLDFGSARSMENGRSVTLMIKHGFAPIEQYQSRGQGTWTDVYAMAATIYYCLTAIVPMQSTERLMEGNVQLKRPTALGVALTPEEEEALMSGLEVHRQDRPQTMREFAERLFPKPTPPKPPLPPLPPDPPDPVRLWFRYSRDEWKALPPRERYKSMWPLWLAGVVALLFALVMLAWMIGFW